MSVAAPPKQMPGYGWKHMPMASAISYSVISIAITLINKAVLSSYSYTSAMTLTLLQGLVTVLCLEGMRLAGWVEYQPWCWETLKKVRPQRVHRCPLDASAPSCAVCGGYQHPHPPLSPLCSPTSLRPPPPHTPPLSFPSPRLPPFPLSSLPMLSFPSFLWVA
jgi:hypothetical protein